MVLWSGPLRHANLGVTLRACPEMRNGSVHLAPGAAHEGLPRMRARRLFSWRVSPPAFLGGESRWNPAAVHEDVYIPWLPGWLWLSVATPEAQPNHWPQEMQTLAPSGHRQIRPPTASGHHQIRPLATIAHHQKSTKPSQPQSSIHPPTVTRSPTNHISYDRQQRL